MARPPPLRRRDGADRVCRNERRRVRSTLAHTSIHGHATRGRKLNGSLGSVGSSPPLAGCCSTALESKAGIPQPLVWPTECMSPVPGRRSRQ